jgi:NADPH-dependent curcumin reductase CurA
MASTNRQVILTRRPDNGVATPDCFAVEEAPMPEPAAGEVLLRSAYLSVDPYLLLQINGTGKYQQWIDPGKPMLSRVAGRVVASNDPAWQVGDAAWTYAPWADYATVKAATLVRADESAAPLATCLGVLGQSGLTAWGGFLLLGQPKAGETVVVTSAAGPVGQAVGQMARIKGCRAVGVAGGSEKCDFVTRELGFDACIDHRRPDFHEALRAAVPNGIDIHWEAVGGSMLDPVLPLLNKRPRIVIVGLIEHYDGKRPMVLTNANSLIDQEVTIRSFHVGSFLDRRDEAARELAGWLRDGSLRYRDTILEGFDQAGRAMAALQSGQVLGKMLVKVS